MDERLGDGVMVELLRDVPLRPCNDCEQLHAGVFCLYYQVQMPEPARPCRCMRFLERQPEVPW